MFLRLKTYVDLVELAKTGEIAAKAAQGERDRLLAGVHAERKEVRRLTDVIIHLKDQDKILPPGFGDQVWGKYIMGEGDAPKEAYQEATPEEREDAIGEAEFHADLERALGDEL